MPLTSTQERPGEVHRGEPVWRLRRADLGDDGCRLGGHDFAAAVRARFGLLRYVWNPSLFVFAVYMIVLSSMVLAVAAR
jgi:hypothetical protein